jgi:hypothetical protein
VDVSDLRRSSWCVDSVNYVMSSVNMVDSMASVNNVMSSVYMVDSMASMNTVNTSHMDMYS